MKTLFIIPLVLMSLVSFPSYSSTLLCGSLSIGCESQAYDDLIYRNDTFYKEFSDTPFTGLVEGEYSGKIENGKQEGVWKVFNSGGQLTMRGEFENGKKTGLWTYFHSNGTVFEKGRYQNDEPEGEWVRFWINGRPWNKQFFKNGLNEGPFIYYHENGQLGSKGDLKNNKKEGVWEFYKKDGTINKEMTGAYKNNVKVSD